MIRDAREPNGTEEDRIMMPDLVETLFWHHSAGFLVESAAPGKLLPLKLNAGFAGRRIDDPNSFRDNLLTNFVSRNHRNSKFLHFCLQSQITKSFLQRNGSVARYSLKKSTVGSPFCLCRHPPLPTYLFLTPFEPLWAVVNQQASSIL